MHILIIALFCTASFLFGSTPQKLDYLDRTTLITLACTKPVAELYHRISPCYNNIPIEKIVNIHDCDIRGEIFFACLPQELRIHALAQNFFYGDTGAAAEFEMKPYAHALFLLAEYQQKSHPRLPLSPKFIFLLHPDQVAVINKIEEQATPTPLNYGRTDTLFFFKNQQHTYANLDIQDLNILKNIPSRVFENSILNGKTIAYSDSLETSHLIIKDTFKSICIDHINHIMISIPALAFKSINFLLNVYSVTTLDFTKYENIAHFGAHVGSFILDIGILTLLAKNIPPIALSHSVPWACIRAAIDAAVLGIIALHYGSTTAYSVISLTSLPFYGPGIVFTIGLVGGFRTGSPYTNKYVIKSYQKKYSFPSCNLL